MIFSGMLSGKLVLASCCLAMNFSGFQASRHNIFFVYLQIAAAISVVKGVNGCFEFLKKILVPLQ
jgi:hypothetical protein